MKNIFLKIGNGLVWFTSHILPATKSDVKRLEKLMLTQIAALQTALTAAVAEISTDLDTLESQITTLKGSGTLGTDDITALNDMQSKFQALQSKADALVAPPAAT